MEKALIFKKRRQYPEAEMQRALIKWWAFAHKGLGVQFEGLLFAVPNQGQRTDKRAAIHAAMMKGLGLRAGVPDLILLVPRGGYHGMLLELKAKSGVTSDAQENFISHAFNQGYYCAVAWSLNDAMMVIQSYLGK